MHSTFLKSLYLAALCVLATAAGAQETWVRCGASIDVVEGRLTDAVTLVMVDERIDRVVGGHPPAEENVEIVDISGLTCLPGLMDMHTHLTSQSSPQRYTEGFTLNEADVALRATVYARRTLDAGFTAVRDVGDSFNVSIALRDAIE
ncbi:MAG: amidohydrolase family protein, partial [Wenzhouxiangellaceae bacterium]|nr:amidohydrolase family protein [Wenzhouxiangellaceae bacterium]